MNKILPSFYKSMYSYCKNSREFVKRFHDEGRHEYDAQSRLTGLEKRIAAVVNPNNPAVAGNYFSEEYILTRSDQTVLKNNLKVVENIKKSIKKEEEDAKNHLSSHFSKSGKILAGHDYAKKFDEEIIGKLIKLQEKVAEIEAFSLSKKLEKTTDMFKHPLGECRRKK